MTPLAKKSFGQHFLRDTGMIERIVRLIDPRPDDMIIEVGAGQGALSSRLAATVSSLLAVEIDNDCIPTLEEALSWFPSASILHADFLQVDLQAALAPYLCPEKSLRAVGNLPFNVATAILARLLDSGLPVRDMVFMVQFEVAERLTSPPGSREYGYLSVLSQHQADIRLEFRVPPACFVPRPQVMSAMVSIRPRPTTMPPQHEEAFREVAKAAFAHRRKTLANSLAKHPLVGPLAHDILARTRIEGRRRPEQLTVAEFELLGAAYLEMKPDLQA